MSGRSAAAPPGRAVTEKTVASNKRARHDYEIVETHEAGIVLTGSEVKSLRAGQANLTDAFATLRDGRLVLNNAHIAPYHQAHMGGHEPKRPRQLLMHRKEVDRLAGKVHEAGLTLVPLRIYFREGLAKVEIALAKGKRKYDKRHALKEREAGREMARAMKERGRRTGG